MRKPRSSPTISRITEGAGRDGVADIGEAGDVGQRALETEAEAGMRQGAVAPEIAVPGVGLPVDAASGHGAVQYVEPLFTLAAADDLADPGANASIAATMRPPSLSRMYKALMAFG
jgi:hypothetical protein